MDASLRHRLVSITDLGTSTLEELTRTLLAVLQSVSGLEASFLTQVDEARQVQEILFTHNARPDRVNVADGLLLPWANTLCRRALDEDTLVTQHADRLWADLDTVHEQNVRTYLGEPVRRADGALLGMLCSVSSERVEVDPETLRVVHMFARLIGHQIERDRHAQSLEARVATLAGEVTTLASESSLDPLTGVANRRALEAGLARQLAALAAGGPGLAVVFVDLDRFKRINDVYGHAVGDRFLVAVAARLGAAAREGDLVARYGGDEFVVVVRLGRAAAAGSDPLEPLRQRFAQATQGHYALAGVDLDYPGASVGVAPARADDAPEALLRRADEAMYVAKRASAQARASWLAAREAALER